VAYKESKIQRMERSNWRPRLCCLEPAIPNLFRLAHHFVNLFRLADHHLTFPGKFVKFITKFVRTFLHFIFLTRISVIFEVFVLQSHSFLWFTSPTKLFSHLFYFGGPCSQTTNQRSTGLAKTRTNYEENIGFEVWLKKNGKIISTRWRQTSGARNW